MAREVTFKTTTYLRINGDGQLYTGSSEPREGYEKVVTKQGNTTYRKYFSGTDFGKITQLGIEEKVFDTGKVRYLTVVVENEDSRDVLQLQLKTQKGGLSDIVRRFIATLPNIDFSRTLTLTSNRKKNDKGYLDRIIFIRYVNEETGELEDEGVKFALKFGKEGDIPSPEPKEGIDGIEWDFTAQDKFLYDRLLEEMERFQDHKNGVKTAPEKAETPAPKNETKSPAKSTKTKVEAEPKVEEEDDDDDLPF